MAKHGLCRQAALGGTLETSNVPPSPPAKPATSVCAYPPLMEGGGMRHITVLAIGLVLLASLVLAGCGGGSY